MSDPSIRRGHIQQKFTCKRPQKMTRCHVSDAAITKYVMRAITDCKAEVRVKLQYGVWWLRFQTQRIGVCIGSMSAFVQTKVNSNLEVVTKQEMHASLSVIRASIEANEKS